MNKEPYFTSQEILELCKNLNIEVKNEKTGESGQVEKFKVAVKIEKITEVEVFAVNIDDALKTVMGMYNEHELDKDFKTTAKFEIEEVKN